MASPEETPITRLNSYVGFETITKQLEHRLLKWVAALGRSS